MFQHLEILGLALENLVRVLAWLEDAGARGGAGG